MSPMDWVSVIVGIVSGTLAAGVAIGVFRTQVQSLRRELEILRQQHSADIRECRDRMDRLINGRGK